MYVATDHKPLMGTFGDRNREHVENLRLRRLKDQTKMFDFNMIHVPAKKHCQETQYVERALWGTWMPRRPG